MATVAVTMTDIQEFDVGPITALDEAGQPIAAAGPLVFAVSDAALLTVTDHGDGTATVATVGPVGQAQMTVTDGVGVGTVDVTITNSAEAGLSVPIAAPHDK